MNKLTEEAKKTLRAIIYDMDRQQMLTLLFMLIEGADIAYAVDSVTSRPPRPPA